MNTMLNEYNMYKNIPPELDTLINVFIKEVHKMIIDKNLNPREVKELVIDEVSIMSAEYILEESFKIYRLKKENRK